MKEREREREKFTDKSRIKIKREKAIRERRLEHNCYIFVLILEQLKIIY